MEDDVMSPKEVFESRTAHDRITGLQQRVTNLEKRLTTFWLVLWAFMLFTALTGVALGVWAVWG